MPLPPGFPTAVGARAEVLDAAGAAHAVHPVERSEGLSPKVGGSDDDDGGSLRFAQPRHPRPGVPRGGGARQEG